MERNRCSVNICLRSVSALLPAVDASWALFPADTGDGINKKRPSQKFKHRLCKREKRETIL